MHILELPNELHLEIGSHLLRKPRATLCLVDRQLRRVFTEVLYSEGCSDALLWAAKCGQVGTLHLAFQHGATADLTDNCNRTPLSYAAERGHTAIVKRLLEKGADASRRDYEDKSPLWYAIGDEHIDSIQLLLQHGAETSHLPARFLTPLYLASIKGNIRIVSMMLGSGANVSAEGGYAKTPLVGACIAGHHLVVKMLAEHGADIRGTAPNGSALSGTAATHGRLEVLKYLLERDHTLIQHLDASGSTPFLLAAYHGQLNVVKYLFEKDHTLNLEFRNREEQTALWNAARQGHMAVVEFLVTNGANVNAVGENGSSPLLGALGWDRHEIARFLIKHGADINLADMQGERPVLSVVKNGHVQFVEHLLNEGAEINTANNIGWTPLFHATQHCSMDMITMLLERCAYTEVILRGYTPLRLACQYGCSGAVGLLITYGADLNSMDDEGESAIDLAVSRGHDDIVKLLTEHGCVPTLKRGEVS
jgi:ankyrin repeat protein